MRIRSIFVWIIAEQAVDPPSLKLRKGKPYFVDYSRGGLPRFTRPPGKPKLARRCGQAHLTMNPPV